MLYETSHDTMSHFVTCGIYSGGMAGMWNPQGQKGTSPCPFCFVFIITLGPEILGMAGASSFANNMCKVWRKGTRESAACQVHHVVGPNTIVNAPQNVSVKGKVASARPCQAAHHI